MKLGLWREALSLAEASRCGGRAEGIAEEKKEEKKERKGRTEMKMEKNLIFFFFCEERNESGGREHFVSVSLSLLHSTFSRRKNL